jgi:hypothetical protein
MAKRKAVELESFDENAVSKQWKSSEQEIERGKAIIEEFIHELKLMSDSDLEKHFATISAKFHDRIVGNGFIQELSVQRDK